jgi:class 3 adenylate cyclase
MVKLKAEKEELLRRLDLQYLLSKVPVKAHAPILSDTSKLKDEFFSEELKGAFVLSIDIRKSTELMLKAKTPDGFAAFMTRLCEQLEALVHANLGIVDKFTGDGLLAFFPQFFSGQDAGYRVVACAHSAHAVFAELYETSYSAFSTVLLDVGLGIGIDYGPVKLVKVAGSLTVVGAAVVYACRMGSAPAGRTYVNQEAYEQIVGKFNNSCSIRKESHSIKDEGTVRNVLAYDVHLNGRKYQPKLPEWLVQVELDGM